MEYTSALVHEFTYHSLQLEQIIFEEENDEDTKQTDRRFKFNHYYSIRNFYQPHTLSVNLKKNQTNLGVRFVNLSNTDITVGVESSLLMIQSLFLHFNCAFLKKEKLYTKLKYSRSPQYDIVSGGVAALFSGFLGFLVSEKFGIELVDSGDFYVLFMYAVFLFFSIRPLVKIITKFDKITPLVSLLPLLNIFTITFKFCYHTVSFYTVLLLRNLKNLK
jgi:hypothetical protein